MSKPEFLDSNKPNLKTIPEGFVLLTRNTQQAWVQAGDLLWTPESGTWESAMLSEFGTPIHAYKAVVRKP